jgi:hypothetical protein
MEILFEVVVILCALGLWLGLIVLPGRRKAKRDPHPITSSDLAESGDSTAPPRLGSPLVQPPACPARLRTLPPGADISLGVAGR